MPRKPHFSIISPGWKCQDYVRAWYQCLTRQKGNYSWTAYGLDDYSNDHTHRRLRALQNTDSRVVALRNSRNRGAAYSRLKLMRMCDPSSIMIMLDLDDWLTDNALQVISRAYSDPDIRATFGSYHTNKGGGVDNRLYGPVEINNNRFYKKTKFQAPPLRTFHASLVESVTNEDMQDASGKWYKTATDVAMSWRFLWDLQDHQIKHIPDQLYVYRQRGGDSAKRFNKHTVVTDLRKKYDARPFPECKNAQSK